MKRFVFTDLDNTIVRHQSRSVEPDSKPVGLDENGQMNTVMTADDLEFFASLKNFGRLIPTTGRSMAGYWRLQGLQKDFTSFAILNHGATILLPPEAKQMATVDPIWLKRTQKIVRRSTHALLEVYQSLLALDFVETAYSNTIKLHQEHGLPLYISVRAARWVVESDLAKQRQAILAVLGFEQTVFEVLHTGRITSIIPKELNKKEAVLEVMKRLEALETLGVGDALTDLPFMRVCTFQSAPKNSEIQRSEHRI